MNICYWLFECLFHPLLYPYPDTKTLQPKGIEGEKSTLYSQNKIVFKTKTFEKKKA